MEITTKNNLRSAGAVVLAMTAITASDAMVKGMLDDIPPFQFLFVRAIVILLILGTALAIKGQRILMPSIRQPFAFLRGGFELMST